MPDRQTDRQTTEDRATQLLYSIQFKLSNAILLWHVPGMLTLLLKVCEVELLEE